VRAEPGTDPTARPTDEEWARSLEVASRLRGKHKPTFCNFQDNGDFIVVVNADKIHLTGKKWDDKKYYRHTGYMGGIKEQTAKEVLTKKPEEQRKAKKIEIKSP